MIRKVSILAASLMLTGLAPVSEAFDKCRQVAENPAAFVERSAALAQARLPFRYFDQASRIKVATPAIDSKFYPFAAEAQPIVVVPSIYPVVFCKIVLAEYLHVGRIREAEFDEAAKSAAQCLDSGGSTRTCLVAFANDLERRYEGVFDSLPPAQLQTALTVLDTAFDQITTHEYAHHVLEHFGRVKSSQLTRQDAEFEADYLAMATGVNAGDIPHALFYYFRPLAEVAQYTQKLSTDDYESGFCRALNVNMIAGAVGLTPSVVLSMLQGTPTNPARVNLSREDMEGPGPRRNPKACGRLSWDVLHGGFEEMKALYQRVMLDESYLAGDTRTMKDVKRTVALVEDLVKMSRTFRYMNVLAAKCVTVLLERFLLAEMSVTHLIRPLGDLLDVSRLQGNAAGFLTADLGRAAWIEGQDILRHRTDLTPAIRLNRSFDLLQKAILYDPSRTDTYADLAIVAFKKGDCAASARFIESLLDADQKSNKFIGVLARLSTLEIILPLWATTAFNECSCFLHDIRSIR